MHLMNHLETAKLENQLEIKRIAREELARQLDRRSPRLPLLLAKVGALLSATGIWLQHYAGEPARPSTPCIPG
jgi:hypothetical protein